MPFVQGKCENCGGILTVDPSLKAAICPFCGAAYVVQDSINNYNTTIKVETMHANVVNISDESSSEARLKAAEAFIKLGDYKKAEDEYRKVTEIAPQNYKGWLGLIESHSQKYTKRITSASELRQLKKYADSVLTLSPPDKGEKLLNDYTKYVLHEDETNISETEDILKNISQLKKKTSNLKKQSNELREIILQKKERIEFIEENYDNTSLSARYYKSFLTIGIILFVLSFICFSIMAGFKDEPDVHLAFLISLIIFLNCAVGFTACAILIKKRWNNRLIESKRLEEEVKELRDQRADIRLERENIHSEISAARELLEKYK